MAQTEPIAYQRVTKGTARKEKPRLRIGSLRRNAALWAAGFFAAMAMPYGGIAPFGLSYLAQEKKMSLGAAATFIAVSLGAAVACDRVGAAKYIGAGIIYLAVLFVLEKGIRVSEVASGLIAGGAVAVSGFAAMVWQEFSFGGVILLLCESASVVAGALVLDKGRAFLQNGGRAAENVTSEEKLSMGAIAAILVMSLKEIYIGSDFSVMNTAASVIILMIACGCGVGYSTGAGVLLGLVCGIGTEYFMPILGAFSFCGFMSGVFSRFGKGGAIAGIVLANAMLIVYTNGAMEMMLTIYEIMAASVIFAFIPRKCSVWLKNTLCLKENDKKSILKVKEGIRQRLSAAAASFESMSKTLDRLSDKENEADMTDVAVLFDAAADKICRDCRKSAVCWGKDFNSTYKSMFRLLEIMEEKGELKEEDVQDYFKQSCLNLPKLLGELNRQFDVYQVRRVWKSKLCECRELVGEQLSGVSRIIDGLAEEINSETGLDSISADDIRARLAGKGIRVQDLSVFQDRNGKHRIELTVKQSLWKESFAAEIKKLMKAVLECDVSLHETVFSDTGLVRMELSEKERYVVETGAACAGASERSGDSYRFLKLGGGKYVAVLSDGMGTGERASRESEAMLELLDGFLQAGFDSRVAVRLINSVMVMKSESESFVTIDMCIIDLYTGKAEFIKTGAEPSFILQKNSVETVRAASLPVGALAGVDAEIAEMDIEDGDTIIMLTDGVETREGGDSWIKKYIEQTRNGKSADAVADGILRRAIEENRGEVNDDMTVLSVRLKARGDVA